MNSDPRTAMGTHSSLVGALPFPILFSRRQTLVVFLFRVGVFCSPMYRVK